MRVRRKKRTKRLIVLLSLLLLGIVGFRNILPNLGDVFQYHHVASGEYGWNLILVNRDNYIPDDHLCGKDFFILCTGHAAHTSLCAIQKRQIHSVLFCLS